MNTEIRAPGEKWTDYTSSYIQPSSSAPHTVQPRRSSISTAHIASSDTGLKDERAKLAFDQLVSECADFLGSQVDTVVKNFAEGIVRLVSNPTAIDPLEMKRRIEQILPAKGAHYTRCRGIDTITSKECGRLCSLADQVVNFADDKELLYIVDEEKNEEIKQNNMGEVEYIRSTPTASVQQIPRQIPSFLEQSDEDRLSNQVEYDLDVTPYDSSGCSTVSNKKGGSSNRFQSLINLARSKNDTRDQNDEHDHVIPTLISELSQNVYSSQTVLWNAFEQLSYQDFLTLADQLYEYNIVGAHIAWASEYSQGDSLKLMQSLPTQELIDHCNDQAEIHELFSSLPKGSIHRLTHSS
ncbi:hypothetical protein K501DRAFT_332642 [Backusella circina FSU 941]|nr:hypothetical protein K501DRAFT_332642 [Backusella circina FSU 941]